MALSRSVFLHVTKATPVLPGVVPPWVFSFSLALEQSRGMREFPNHQPAQAAKTLRAFHISACHSGTRKRSKDIKFHQRQETTEFIFETNTVDETSKEGNGETPSPGCVRCDMFETAMATTLNHWTSLNSKHHLTHSAMAYDTNQAGKKAHYVYRFSNEVESNQTLECLRPTNTLTGPAVAVVLG